MNNTDRKLSWIFGSLLLLIILLSSCQPEPIPTVVQNNSVGISG